MTIGIDITLGEVSKTAGSIRQINKSLSERLKEIRKEMDDLSTSWESDASETIRNKFKSLQPRFDEYAEVVESYAKFLDFTVTSYTDTEKTINSDASAFK